MAVLRHITNENTQYSETVKPHSIEISTSAKGAVSWTIKIYCDDPEETMNRVLAIHNKLCQKFPGSSTEAIDS